jgi:pantothenate synthetase
MAKIIIAVSLIFLLGGGWLALDYLNKQEQARALEIHKGIEQARLESKRRLGKRSNFESVIHATQADCEAAADKAKVDYMALMLKILPVKSRALGGLPQTVSSQAEAILQSAKTECQSTATNILSKGI